MGRPHLIARIIVFSVNFTLWVSCALQSVLGAVGTHIRSFNVSTQHCVIGTSCLILLVLLFYLLFRLEQQVQCFSPIFWKKINSISNYDKTIFKPPDYSNMHRSSLGRIYGNTSLHTRTHEALLCLYWLTSSWINWTMWLYPFMSHDATTIAYCMRQWIHGPLVQFQH